MTQTQGSALGSAQDQSKVLRPGHVMTARIEVKRDQFREARIVRSDLDIEAAVAAGQTVLAINDFALTANNITYAAFGEQMSYWNFFPTADGYGQIPVWGFADVLASATPGLAAGERFFGYFPMASHLVVTADKVGPKRFVDASAHRAALPAVYNAYERTAADPGYAREREGAQMILRPLVITSFLIADFLDDNKLFGARQVLVSSASSKTSIGLAFCLKRLALAGVQVVGLTSGGNRAFVEGLGLYDRVVTYDAVGGLDALVPSVYVDMAGSAEVLTDVHTRFGDQLVYSCRVGGTHWEGLAGRMTLPGARPVFFFAPTQVVKRAADWGPGGLETRFGAVWTAMLGSVKGWLRIDTRHGPEATLAAYFETLEGRVRPEAGLVLSMNG
jgi:Protein of unknown function (DUF2855)